MNILYLTNGFPYPLTSGYLRHYHLIRQLSQRHAITLLSLANHTFRPEHVAGIAEFTRHVQAFPVPRHANVLLRKGLQAGRLLAGSGQAIGRMRAATAELVRHESFDAVIFSGKHTLPALAPLQHLPTIVDICDAASVRIKGRLKYARWYERPRLLTGYAFMRRVERKLTNRASHMMFASCRDKELLACEQPGQLHATVVPNGVDIEYWQHTTHRRPADTIVFTGAMHYPPNADAAVFLAQDILPRVQRAVPEARLLIVGRDPVPRVRQLEQRPGVTVTGFVEDVRPYLEQGTLFAAPLRFGAGIQNKVLEAMAMGLPIVASPLAADGLRTERGDRPPITLAETAGDFAEQIVHLLANARQNQATSKAVRDYVAQHFVWQESAQLVEQVLQQVTGRNMAGTPPSAAIRKLAEERPPYAKPERGKLPAKGVRMIR